MNVESNWLIFDKKGWKKNVSIFGPLQVVIIDERELFLKYLQNF